MHREGGNSLSQFLSPFNNLGSCDGLAYVNDADLILALSGRKIRDGDKFASEDE